MKTEIKSESESISSTVAAIIREHISQQQHRHWCNICGAELDVLMNLREDLSIVALVYPCSVCCTRRN